MSRFCLLLLLVVVPAACAPATSTWDPLAVAPERPVLEAGADTNSALAYYAHGARVLEQSPRTAAAAFYWASRLDPTWGDPLYARRAALLVSNPRTYFQYLDEDSPIHDSPGMIALDSMMLRALQLNPLLEPKVDLAALNFALDREIRSQDPSLLDTNIDWLVHDWMLRQDPATRAWFAYAEQRYPSALELYEMANRIDPDRLGLQFDMAHVLFRLGRYDDAVATMSGAIETLRERDDERLVRLYQSKALFEHFIGLVHEVRGDTTAARDAYARALTEDLAYHPAHLRLGELALLAGDTVTALSELALAAQIRENDPVVRFRYGLMLLHMRRFAEAEPQLRRAIELEPYFADPYRLLAVAVDFQGRGAEAAPIYREFLDRGSQDAAGRDAVTRRLEQLAVAAAHDGSAQ